MIELIGLVVAFALIVSLPLKRVNIALSISIAAIVVAIFSGKSIQEFALGAFFAIIDQTTVTLAMTVTTIGILGYCMRQTHLIDDLVGGLKKILPGRILIAVIPAIIGLMPMPGGALFSAPLIEDEASRLHLSAEKKTVVNIVFRHVWFYSFPLSTTLIFASGLTGVSLFDLMVIQLPSFFVAIALGYVMVLHGLARTAPDGGQQSRSIVLAGLAPILAAVLLNMSGLNLALSVSLGIVVALLIKRVRIKESLTMLWKGIPWTPVLSIIAVMILARMIEDSGVIPILTGAMKGANVPLLVFASLVPFILGVVSGLPMAGIGISVPIILSLAGSPTPALVSVIVLATYAGYYVSPLHLCLLLSNQYYRAKIQGVYRTWIPYVFAVCGVGILLDYLWLSIR
ncbi:MAG: DUF401 family protein [archaeon]